MGALAQALTGAGTALVSMQFRVGMEAPAPDATRHGCSVTGDVASEHRRRPLVRVETLGGLPTGAFEDDPNATNNEFPRQH